jgi:hypothetical protein
MFAAAKHGRGTMKIGGIDPPSCDRGCNVISRKPGLSTGSNK